MATDRNSRVLRAIPLLIAVCLISFPAQAQYGGGNGTVENPYLIYTAEQMNAIGVEPNDWDKNFKLMEDIDLVQYTGTQFNIIGHFISHSDNKPFTGVFEGNGKTISNFNYDSTGSNDIERVGLFGWLERSEIKDLKLVDPNIIAKEGSYVGALIGRADHVTIMGCCVEGGYISGKLSVGGLVGYCIDTSVSSCYSIVSVTGERTVGGLVGNMSGRVDSCYSEGNVMGQSTVGGFAGYSTATLMSCYSMADVVCTDKYAGGLVGYNWREIISCRASGNVEGNDTIGGLAGINNYTITHSYANGVVHGNIEVGGLVGKNNSRIRFSYSTGLVWGGEYVTGLANGGSVYLCYWDIETGGVREGEAGKGKTTAQMQSASTFRGWGYECQWVLDEGNDYPRLIWEDAPGELLIDQLRSYDGGKGEPNNPYQIYTAQQFASIAYYLEDYDKHFILTNDIDLSTISPDEITPIGSSGISFTGSFLGNGHAIMNLECRANELDFMGMFGYIGQNGYVEDLQLINISVAGNEYVGGLAGCNLGIVKQCSIDGIVEGGEQCIGGLVGSNTGHITRCSTNGQVTGSRYVGGLAGYNGAGAILACSSNSGVIGKIYVGGLVGLNGRPSYPPAGCAGLPPGSIPYPPKTSISSCYSAGYVEGHKQVGGLVGENGGSIQFSYSASPVVGTVGLRHASFPTSVGGLVGTDNYGMALLSYWDAEGSGQSLSAAGKGKTTKQMMTKNTFRGWGYLGEWVINHGNDYPHLVWEGLGGELIVDDPNRYAIGTGQPEDPYRIHTIEEFINIGVYPGDWDRCFVLTNDIDFNDVDPNMILPIGIYGIPFTGTFEGNNFTISNFKYLSETESYIGIFGSIGPEDPYGQYAITPQEPNNAGSVINLNIENLDVSAYSCAGGLAGYNGGRIFNCSIQGDVISVLKNAGGLLGYNTGEVIECNAECNIDSEHVVGGIIGLNNGTVLDSSASGQVTGTYYVGGFIGRNGYQRSISGSSSNGIVIGKDIIGGLVGENGGDILNCYAKGHVNGIEHIAGLVGRNYETIMFCYSSCTVSGQEGIAGLVSDSRWGDITSCFWDTDFSGLTDGVADLDPDPEGVIGLSTAEMQISATFLEADWDFVDETANGSEDIWWILEGQDYPRLWWEAK